VRSMFPFGNFVMPVNCGAGVLLRFHAFDCATFVVCRFSEDSCCRQSHKLRSKQAWKVPQKSNNRGGRKTH